MARSSSIRCIGLKQAHGEIVAGLARYPASGPRLMGNPLGVATMEVQSTPGAQTLNASSEPLHYIQTPSSGVGLFALDAEGFCVYASPAAEEILGFGPGGMLGFGWLECIDGPDLVRFLVKYVEAVSRREPLTRRCRIRRPRSGSSDVVELRLSPLQPPRTGACCVGTVQEQAV